MKHIYNKECIEIKSECFYINHKECDTIVYAIVMIDIINDFL